MKVTGNRDKESRKHCKSSGCPQKDSAEHEEYAGALTGSGITENNITNADRPEDGLLEEIRQTIKDGKYRPQPVLRVEIPKEDGKKKRKLGIPTAADRVIQQAIAQVLTPIYEPRFSDNSYGFRPRRSTHDAIRAC